MAVQKYASENFESPLSFNVSLLHVSAHVVTF